MVFPLNDGKCALGEIRGQGSFDVTMQAQGSVSLSALECVGSALYNSRSSYYLKLHDLKLQGSPRLSGKRLHDL